MEEKNRNKSCLTTNDPPVFIKKCLEYHSTGNCTFVARYFDFGPCSICSNKLYFFFICGLPVHPVISFHCFCKCDRIVNDDSVVFSKAIRFYLCYRRYGSKAFCDSHRFQLHEPLQKTCVDIFPKLGFPNTISLVDFHQAIGKSRVFLKRI